MRENTYQEQERVRPHLPAFAAIREEMERRGDFPYNDSFRGRIPEIAGPDEDRSIYRLQCLYRIEREKAEIAALRAEGFAEVGNLDEPTRYPEVVLWREGFYVGGTGKIERYESARIIPDKAGVPYAVLPKGRRTHGARIDGAHVLVRTS